MNDSTCYEYICLKKELKEKIKRYNFSSEEVLKVSQKLDDHIVNVMKNEYCNSI